MSVTSIVLSSLGGLCQLGGLVLVIIEIADDRAHAKRLFVNRRRSPRRQRTYPPKRVGQRFSGSTMAPVHAQHEAVLRSISQLKADMNNAVIMLWQLCDKQLDA